MKSRFSVLFLLVASVVVFTACQRNATQPETNTTGAQARPAAASTATDPIKQFRERINAHGDKLVLVDFTASWCRPCQMLKPHLHALAQRYPNQLVVLEEDIDANPAVAEMMQIQSIPFLVLYKNGQEVDKFLGYMDFAQLDAWARVTSR
jgi:thioredoxin 1